MMKTYDVTDIRNIEINDEFKAAFDRLEHTAQNVFITGKAGTGKSTFLHYFRRNSKKNLVVLAPTGVAAVNVKGQTIHSFFNFKPDITPDGVAKVRVLQHMRRVYEKLQMIIIDEVSMVRADMIDCIDAFLKLHGNPKLPFGGVQMVFVGDLYQLSPVVRADERSIFSTVYRSPYFFDARILKAADLDLLEFERNYRQKDDTFIGLLNRIRTNTLEQEHLDIFNERCQPDFQPKKDEFVVYLTTTNDLADTLNTQRLHELTTELFLHDGVISGEFDAKILPTQERLELRVGAQVIFLNNDPNRRWVNGTIGKVIDIATDGYEVPVIQIELFSGERVEVEPFTWEIFKFFYNEETGAIESDVVGTFRQLPLKLAWAVTIHKSQGKTFDRVIIDIGRGAFCHGQIYVALSRCTTLDGIILKRPISRQDIFTDKRIAEFLTRCQYRAAEQDFPLETRRKILKTAILDGKSLDILYLKENGEKNRLTVTPRCLRSIEYNQESCQGVEAFCHKRQTHVIFRLNCILELKEAAPLS